jgi:hypothetical protein
VELISAGASGRGTSAENISAAWDSGATVTVTAYHTGITAIIRLVRALDDILDPQANLCSGGSDKRITAARIRQIVPTGRRKFARAE